MTPKKDWFDTYKPYNGGMIQMGNDATCPVTGIGTMKIKMFDGVVRVLSNVRHIPNLRKKVSTLHKLIGNTAVGRVTVTTLIESSTDDTKLWHM